MSQSLKQLVVTREARREAAMTRLASARKECDLAHAACRQAHAEFEQSKQWHAEVLASCTLGAGQAIRDSALPACEALLQQRQQRFTQTQADLRSAYERVVAERQALMTCERDSLRLQEWETLQQALHRRDLALHENREDEEHAHRSLGRTGAG